MSGQDRLYILGFHRCEANATKNRQLDGWSQLIKVICKERKQPLLTSGFEASFDNIQRKRPFVREYECWRLAAIPLSEFNIGLELRRQCSLAKHAGLEF